MRSLLEYCSVVWYSILTGDQSHNLERVQKLCLRIILGEDYCGFDSALDSCGLEKLSVRREAKCLKFGLKSLLHPTHSSMFPVNPQVLTNPDNARSSEHFLVNFSRTESYGDSTIPYIQKMLNKLVQNQQRTESV